MALSRKAQEEVCTVRSFGSQNGRLALCPWGCVRGAVQAQPRLTAEKVKQCVDSNIRADCPEKSVAKVTHPAPTYHLTTLRLNLNRALFEP